MFSAFHVLCARMFSIHHFVIPDAPLWIAGHGLLCRLPDSRAAGLLRLAGKGEMIAMTDPTLSNEPAGRWLVKLPAAASDDRRADLNLADLNDDLLRDARPSRRRRIILAVARFALTFGIGIAATLAWQPYGDAAREMIASSSPQLGWLAPQPAPAVANREPLAPPDATPTDLDAVRERIDRIATGQDQMTRIIGQLTATQERIAQEIVKVREVEQYLLYKISYKEPELVPRAVTLVAATAPSAHKHVRRPSARR
jgi:hypothetical protein